MFYISIPYIKDSFRNFFRGKINVRRVKSLFKERYGIHYWVSFDEDRPSLRKNSIVIDIGEDSLDFSFYGFFKPAVIHRVNRKTVTVPRHYGIAICSSEMEINYGTVNMYDYQGVKNQSKRFRFPWQERRTTSLCVLDPSNFSVVLEFVGSGMSYSEYQDYKKNLSKPTYNVIDYDGTPATMTVHIERHIVERGSGMFEWLRRFRKPEIEQDMILTFNQYLGCQKHSWKGGSAGASVRMQEGETIQEALDRFFKNPHEFNNEFPAMKLVSEV